MVDRQIRLRGVRHAEVLRAMEEVQRELFLPPAARQYAYDDAPVPISEGQTMSQPYMVAFMLEALQPQPWQRVLEVGTGSGYAAAVLSRMVRHVFTVERHASLASVARERFQALGYDNLTVGVGDGSTGWEEYAPFDGIVVAAGAPAVPESLCDQLAVGGRLVVPVGTDRCSQQLVCLYRTDANRVEELDLGEVRFVPLIGREGWP